ncbi:hypothetical protein ATEIFO6365_0007014000 [Aspergillus terreus]|uniref:Uncharacterized protein n=1 Tax=Aspergillus terreus TaxID=33178 RepID=A0A5M3Z436_ASPTE|nr:hypothetical protein ATETN484_0009014000 [Aspergillus terreus]GFF17591.1 hypothetical protein ATEIFO6365_0007014000 [Aspergillus terreus]
MQFIKAITLFSLVATGLAIAVPETKSAAFDGGDLDTFIPPGQGQDGQDGALMHKRGYGCPNDYSCSNYCSSIGRNGGYCGGFLWQTCKCNEKK